MPPTLSLSPSRHVLGLLGCFDPAFQNKAVPNLNMSFLLHYPDIFLIMQAVQLHGEVDGVLLDELGIVLQVIGDKVDHCGAISRMLIVGNDKRRPEERKHEQVQVSLSCNVVICVKVCLRLAGVNFLLVQKFATSQLLELRTSVVSSPGDEQLEPCLKCHGFSLLKSSQTLWGCKNVP